MNIFLNRLCLSLAVLTVWLALPTATRSDDQSVSRAVILMYHRFGESGLPSTNISIKQLEQHIAALQTRGHTVVPLDLVADALEGKAALPDKAVAITVDDAYRSFMTEGWPRFQAAGFPVTLFVATEGVSAGYSDLLSWDEIRALRRDGVSIGAHSHSHAHYPSLSAEQMRDDLKRMSDSFEAELGVVPDLFAYPYGEASLEEFEAVNELGFRAAFGQHSGAVGPEHQRMYLPRFSLNEAFGDQDRFNLIIDTLPLPVIGVNPANTILQTDTPAIGLFLKDAPPNIGALTCFGPGGKRLDAVASSNSVRLMVQDPIRPGRARLNCTLPVADRQLSGRWHWFGWQFIAGYRSEGAEVHSRYR